MSIINVLLVYVIFMGIIVGLPVMIGVYVYRDAKRRNMNAVLWTLIAIVAPSLIGFIIYLCVRGSYDDLRCARCNAAVSQQYIVCPSCGAKLKPVCTNCNEPVESDWTVCPKCAQPLSNVQDDVVVPMRKKDKTLQRILVVVIIIPIAIILVMFISLILFQVSTSSGGTATMETTVEDYLESINEPRIAQWIEDCEKEPRTAYVLKYYKEEPDSEERVRYLIYIPNAKVESTGISDGIFGTTLRMEFESYDAAENVVLITRTGEDASKVKIYLDDKKLDIEMEEVDFSPALSEQQIYDMGAEFSYEITK